MRGLSLDQIIDNSYIYPSKPKPDATDVFAKKPMRPIDNSLDNPTFAQFILQDNRYVFGALVSILALLFGLVRCAQANDPFAAIVLVLFFGVSLFLVSKSARKEYLWRDATEQRFDAIENDTATTQFILKNNVNMSKSVHRIKHIRNHPEFMVIIGRLHRFETYDEGVFTTVVSALERFFRYYEGILMDRAPCNNILRHMTDLRAEILNQMAFLMSFNIRPSDVDEVRKLSAAIQSKTRRFMRIVSRKCDAEQSKKGIGSGLFMFLDGVDCANASDPSASSMEMF